jgi:hypothetical protein
MQPFILRKPSLGKRPTSIWAWIKSKQIILTLLLFAPIAAYGQGSPFDTGFNPTQRLA